LLLLRRILLLKGNPGLANHLVEVSSVAEQSLQVDQVLINEHASHLCCKGVTKDWLNLWVDSVTGHLATGSWIGLVGQLAQIELRKRNLGHIEGLLLGSRLLAELLLLILGKHHLLLGLHGHCTGLRHWGLLHPLLLMGGLIVVLSLLATLVEASALIVVAATIGAAAVIATALVLSILIVVILVVLVVLVGLALRLLVVALVIVLFLLMILGILTVLLVLVGVVAVVRVVARLSTLVGVSLRLITLLEWLSTGLAVINQSLDHALNVLDLPCVLFLLLLPALAA